MIGLVLNPFLFKGFIGIAAADMNDKCRLVFQASKTLFQNRKPPLLSSFGITQEDGVIELDDRAASIDKMLNLMVDGLGIIFRHPFPVALVKTVGNGIDHRRWTG